MVFGMPKAKEDGGNGKGGNYASPFPYASMVGI
jgi:hypothetical protein